MKLGADLPTQEADFTKTIRGTSKVEGVYFLWDLIGNSDSETMKIEERARWRAQEGLLILKGSDHWAIENRVWASMSLRAPRTSS